MEDYASRLSRQLQQRQEEVRAATELSDVEPKGKDASDSKGVKLRPSTASGPILEVSVGSQFFASGKDDDIKKINTVGLYYSPTVDHKYVALKIQTSMVFSDPPGCKTDAQLKKPLMDPERDRNAEPKIPSVRTDASTPVPKEEGVPRREWPEEISELPASAPMYVCRGSSHGSISTTSNHGNSTTFHRRVPRG